MEARRIATSDGTELAVRVWPAGGGRPFVLVHGLASNARMWDGVAEHLVASGHPVAAVDLRGHGRSDKPDDGYDFATVTDDLVAVIGALGWDRPVAAGQSWGGNVVLELAYRHPALTAGLACVDGGTIDLSERFSTWEACEAALAPPRTAGTTFDQIESMFRRRHADWPEAGIQGALACFERRADGTAAPRLTFERHMRIVRAMWEQKPSKLYPAIEVPVLLVPADSGEAGRRAGKPSSVAAAEAALPVARTRWMVGDHDLHAQHPAALAELLHASVDDGFFR